MLHLEIIFCFLDLKGFVSLLFATKDLPSNIFSIENNRGVIHSTHENFDSAQMAVSKFFEIVKCFGQAPTYISFCMSESGSSDLKTKLNIKSGVGLLLTEVRANLGINQTELAKILGLNPATISRYENGHHKARATQLRLWSKILSVHVPPEIFEKFAILANQQSEQP